MCNVRHIAGEICIESWSEISLRNFTSNFNYYWQKTEKSFLIPAALTTKILIIDNNTFKLEESNTISTFCEDMCNVRHISSEISIESWSEISNII